MEHSEQAKTNQSRAAGVEQISKACCRIHLLGRWVFNDGVVKCSRVDSGSGHLHPFVDTVRSTKSSLGGLNGLQSSIRLGKIGENIGSYCTVLP